MNKLTCVRGVAQRDEIGVARGDMHEGPAALRKLAALGAAHDVYPRSRGRHRGSIGGKPSRAFLESATKPWLVSRQGSGEPHHANRR